ncbi:hypothetical protein [Duganella radicis]|uniref:hypothetical protein n=1 Tax=Duganella radicis TaxID=551988 RepID=UPI001E41ED7B|nr:hypothetical protein [Duganella radicis]
MADSTLDPDNIPAGNDRTLGRGHGTRALGPSDNSDSGSDVVGEPDTELDSDTDAEGTGERASVDMSEAGSDIGFDHVEAIPVVDGEFREAVPEPDDDNVERDVPPQLARVERRDWSRTSG